MTANSIIILISIFLKVPHSPSEKIYCTSKYRNIRPFVSINQILITNNVIILNDGGKHLFNYHTLTLLHRFMYYIIIVCMINKLRYFVKILPISSL